MRGVQRAEALVRALFPLLLRFILEIEIKSKPVIESVGYSSEEL